MPRGVYRLRCPVVSFEAPRGLSIGMPLDAPWCLSIALPRGVHRCPVESIDCDGDAPRLRLFAVWLPRGVYRLRCPWLVPRRPASKTATIATTLYSEAIRQARPRWRGREADVPACASAPRPLGLGGPLGGAVCCPHVPARAPPDAGSLCLCAGAVARASEPHQELGEEGRPELLGGQPPEHEDPPVRGHREQGARGGGRCLDARRAPVHLRDHGRPEPVDGGCPEQPPLHSGRFAYPRQAIQEQCPGELAGEGRKRRT